MATSLPIKLDSLYLTQSLDKESFYKILGDGNPSVLFRMYYLAAGIKERQDFLELTEEEKSNYYLTAAIYTKSRLHGAALEQFQKTAYKNKMNHSPYYRIRVILNEKRSGKDIINFETKISNKTKVYDLVESLKIKINNLL